MVFPGVVLGFMIPGFGSGFCHIDKDILGVHPQGNGVVGHFDMGQVLSASVDHILALANQHAIGFQYPVRFGHNVSVEFENMERFVLGPFYVPGPSVFSGH